MATLDEALTLAVRRARKADWHGAHELVQQHEGEAHADWLHAVLHRMEGDLGNARYWYRRSGRMLPENESPEAELARIADTLAIGQRDQRDRKSKPRRKGRT